MNLKDEMKSISDAYSGIKLLMEQDTSKKVEDKKLPDPEDKEVKSDEEVEKKPAVAKKKSNFDNKVDQLLKKMNKSSSSLRAKIGKIK